MLRHGVLAALAAMASAQAASRWVEVDSGPFRVFSDGGLKGAEATLGELEQFRYTFSTITGVSDPGLVWPLALVARRREGAAGVPVTAMPLGRDARFAAVAAGKPLTPALLERLARLFCADNLKPLPAAEENGLAASLAGFSSVGTHVTIHPPEAAAERTRDWGRIFRLVSDPTTRGETHVFLANLGEGADLDTAYRNAFRKNATQMDADLDAFLGSAVFPDIEFAGRALSPARDFRPQELDDDDEALLRADLMLAEGDVAAARNAYGALTGSKADEGSGLAALAAHDTAGARKAFAAAVQENSKNARTYYELALLDGATERAQAELQKASSLNPRWPAPPVRLAAIETAPAGKVSWLQKAVALAPRDLDLWRALADSAEAAGEYGVAERAWSGAFEAAPTAVERQRIEAARQRMLVARADAAEADRKREEAARTADIDRVKRETMGEIHAAEEQANRAMNPSGQPITNAVPYSSLDAGGTELDGSLERVDCRGKDMTLFVRGADGVLTRLPIPDPSHLTSAEGGAILACGVPKPPRHIIVTYKPGKTPVVLSVQFP